MKLLRENPNSLKNLLESKNREFKEAHTWSCIQWKRRQRNL